VFAGGLPPLLEIIDHLSVNYQGSTFVAMHRPPAAPAATPGLPSSASYRPHLAA
jgi:hypothetical protein